MAVDYVHSNTKDTIGLSPSTMLVVATSHKPYMRLILVEIPMNTGHPKAMKLDKVQTYYDKILRNFATEIYQDDFSLPILGKLESSNGVLVGNDEGIYSVDLMTGDSRI
ncbi:ADM_collapsed_G0022180.mRNA.1.CDS.1 [Saccharomyces cerevisiae]|nr:ADM_collapsed_G0022180.mRNA.1.CDS.1 [Saccharomyces cerevisiae]